jgi:hypothetical protein
VIEALQRLVKWGIWTVGISLVSIGWCMLLLRNHKLLDRLSAPWARGELLLIAVTIVGSSVGDLLTARGRNIPMRPHLAGAAILFLLITAGWYIDVLSCVSSYQWYDDELVRHRSPYMLGLSLLIGGACVMLSKEAQRR